MINPLVPTSHPAATQLSLGQTILTRDYLLKAAKSSGFHQRTPRKIHACDLLATVCAECLDGSPSCNDLATSLDAASPQLGPSRQAVALRMGEPFAKFIQQILGDVIAIKIAGEKNLELDSQSEALVDFAGYSRVLVQDSTIIRLPSHLFEEFSGVSNGASIVCNARVQATYDLLAGCLVDFSIDPYSKNDLKAAPELICKAGDLVLRDRGYLVMNELQRHLDAGADCIYRHKTGFIYLEPETHLPIDLTAMLRTGNGCLDIAVALNNPERTLVRLVSAPVSEETANLRRMRAKKENVGHNPSKALLELMNWSIFITTIPAERCDFKQLLAIYGLRWRIEVIFKAWKSHMSFAQLHRVSRSQMMILLKVRLLLVTCCTNLLYGPLSRAIWRQHRRHLSLLKLMKFLSTAPHHFLQALDSLKKEDAQNRSFYETLLRYCCYDKRKRLNFTQIFEQLA